VSSISIVSQFLKHFTKVEKITIRWIALSDLRTTGPWRLRKLIPGLSRTSTDFQGLSSPGIFFSQLKDFPGFSRPVDTLVLLQAGKCTVKLNKLTLCYA
jgi:hypothetical protein